MCSMTLEAFLKGNLVIGLQTKDTIGLYFSTRPLCWITQGGHVLDPPYMPDYIKFNVQLQDPPGLFREHFRRLHAQFYALLSTST